MSQFAGRAYLHFIRTFNNKTALKSKQKRVHHPSALHSTVQDSPRLNQVHDFSLQCSEFQYVITVMLYTCAARSCVRPYSPPVLHTISSVPRETWTCIWSNVVRTQTTFYYRHTFTDTRRAFIDIWKRIEKVSPQLIDHVEGSLLQTRSSLRLLFIYPNYQVCKSKPGACLRRWR